uniref:Uncharacterized protein n=1 Tax=Fagus sylvatica TaxID=28930 RepID=A0A2N9GZR0_FAGSY
MYSKDKQDTEGLVPLGWDCHLEHALWKDSCFQPVGLGSSFFRRPGYVLDGAVLMGALVLEVFLERKGGGLLVVVSLWRVVRVVESAFELSDEAIEAQIEAIVSQFEALREENRRLLETIAEKDKMIEKLKEEVDQCRHACNGSSTYQHIVE